MADADNPGERGLFNTVLRWLSVLATLLATAVGYWTYETGRKLDAWKKDFEERELHHRINLDVYQVVAQAISRKDADLCLAAAEVVLNVRRKSDFERGLCEALLQAQHCRVDTEERLRARCDLVEAGDRQTADYGEAVRRDLASPVPTGRFDRSPGRAPAATVVAPPAQQYNLRDWDFDLFYCESTASSDQALATAMADALRRQHGARGRVRVRVLSRTVHRRSAYRSISGYQISGTPDELPMVTVLQDIARQAIQREFTYRQTTEQTRWYVSLFFCGGGPSG